MPVHSTTRKTPRTSGKTAARRKRKAPAKKDLGPPISEIFARIASKVPASEWAKLPRDGAANVDHYLYGHPKQYPDLDSK